MNISCNNDIPAETLDVAEQRKAKQRAYYQNNKEDILAQGKAYRKANPDYDKARYLENKEDILARCKAYGESNKDRIAARNKNKSDETWEEIYKHLGTTCSCPTCIWPSKLALEVDHILPVKQGPHKDAPRTGVALRKYIIKHQCWDDFQLLCANCNRLKHHHGICNCGDPTRKSR